METVVAGRPNKPGCDRVALRNPLAVNGRLRKLFPMTFRPPGLHPLLSVAMITSAYVAPPETYVFNRKFNVGDSDTYAVQYLDSAHTDSPYRATVTELVTAVNPRGGATLSIVTSNATKTHNGQQELDTNGDGSFVWAVNRLGVPAVPNFPELGYMDAIALGMQGFIDHDSVGRTASLPLLKSANGATLAAQSTLVSVGASVVFHVTGSEARANGQPAGTLDCTLTLDSATSKITQVNFVVTQEQLIMSGTLTRTAP